jgi:hypothetical protein
VTNNHTAHDVHAQHMCPATRIIGAPARGPKLGSDVRDGVVWPWCKTPKASGGSAESPPAPHACYPWHRRKHFLPACAGLMCVHVDASALRAPVWYLAWCETQPCQKLKSNDGRFKLSNRMLKPSLIKTCTNGCTLKGTAWSPPRCSLHFSC